MAAQAESLGQPFVPTLRDEGALQGAVNQPRQTFGGADLYPSIFDKVAVLVRGIICNHVFTDGNKRTALLAAAIFLQYNGWRFELPDQDLEKLALDIAGDRARGAEPIGLAEIARRLEQTSRPADSR